MSLLEVEKLAIKAGDLSLVDGVDIDIRAGEIVALVGESGSGKSLTALSVMGLLAEGLEVTGGEIRFEGKRVGQGSAAIDRLRGRELAMIFQEPVSSLNPLMPVGAQVAESLVVHGRKSEIEARRVAVEMLRRVGIPEPERRAQQLPAELSGGMCQRVMIALAFASEPELLIADEPTTGLDVTTQAVIMDLIREKSSQRRMSTILITHDLTLAAEYCDRFAVMHAGHIVEQGTTSDIFQRATHPYTGLLMKATPHGAATLSELAAIPGSLPDLRRDLPPCRFAHRCPQSTPGCAAPLPRVPLDASHEVACHMPWKESA